MTERMAIVVCSECGTASNVPEAEEHPFRCKCWKGPRWQIGTWFKEADWTPKSTMEPSRRGDS